MQRFKYFKDTRGDFRFSCTRFNIYSDNITLNMVWMLRCDIKIMLYWFVLKLCISKTNFLCAPLYSNLMKFYVKWTVLFVTSNKLISRRELRCNRVINVYPSRLVLRRRKSLRHGYYFFFIYKTVNNGLFMWFLLPSSVLRKKTNRK